MVILATTSVAHKPGSEVGSLTSTKNMEVTIMEVVMMVKFDTPKEPDRNKKRYEFMAEQTQPYYQKKTKEGVKWKATGWSNGTGTVIAWYEFETLDDFNKIWGDEEFQKNMALWSYFVDNCQVEILWPSKMLPPK